MSIHQRQAMKGPSCISTNLPPMDHNSSSSRNKTTTMKQLLTPSSTRSVQGTRVQQELEVLRQKQLAQSQRNKLKDRMYYSVYIMLHFITLVESIYVSCH